MKLPFQKSSKHQFTELADEWHKTFYTLPGSWVVSGLVLQDNQTWIALASLPYNGIVEATTVSAEGETPQEALKNLRQLDIWSYYDDSTFLLSD